MKTETSPIYPLKTLRDYATSLEAALSICMCGTTPAAVHRVRTRIRRIEAQLMLLAQISILPVYKKQARKLEKHLKKLLKIVSPVGDLDVQCGLIDYRSGSETNPASKRLLAYLKHQREQRTPALGRQLQRSSIKISRALGLLFAALGPDKGVVLSATELIRRTQGWFQLQPRSGSTNKQLHATRKAARLARYMAEGAPDSAEARRVAKTFASIQQAGGEWHDWFQLSDVAAKKLRKNHRLVQILKQKCKSGAEFYRGKLSL